MITIIMPENRLLNIKRIGELERTVQFYQQQRRASLKERSRWLELFEDLKEMADLPAEHIVCKILKAEFSADV